MDRAGAKGNTNQVGPYTVLRRLRGMTDGVGRMYAARHTGTSTPAVLVIPRSKGHFQPAEAWRLRVCASTSPAYLALEVEQASGSAPVKQMAAGLDALTCALEGLENNPEAAEHLLATPRAVRATGMQRARTPDWAALACGVLLAALVLVPHDGSVPPPQEASAEALALHVPLPDKHDAGVLGNAVGAIARGMPTQPFVGQKLSPCVPRLEVEMLGACWVEISAKAPCHEKAIEHKERCYLPVFEAPRGNQAIHP